MCIPKGCQTGLHKDFAKILIDFINNGSHMGTQGSPKRQPIFQFWGSFWKGSWAIVPASRRGDPGRPRGPDEPKFGRGPGDGKIDKSIVFALYFEYKSRISGSRRPSQFFEISPAGRPGPRLGSLPLGSPKSFPKMLFRRLKKFNPNHVFSNPARNMKTLRLRRPKKGG